MAAVITDIVTAETQGLETLGASTAGVTNVSSPTPWHSDETRVFMLDDVPGAQQIQSNITVESGDFLHTFIVQVDNVSAIPGGGQQLLWLAQAGAAGAQHIAIKIADAIGGGADGEVTIYDKNDVQLGPTLANLSADTWYAFFIYWQKSASADVQVIIVDLSTMAIVANESSVGRDTEGDVSASVTWSIFGAAAAGATPYTVYAGTGYVMTDAADITDRKLARAIGPWQTVHNESAADEGDSLLSDTWDEIAETPANGTNQANYQAGTAAAGGSKACDGTARAGPSGDSRMVGDILAQLWVHDGGPRGKTVIYGKANAAVTVFTTSTGGAFTNGNISTVQDAVTGAKADHVAAADEWAMLGFNGTVAARASGLVEAWSFSLVEHVGRAVRLVDGGMLPPQLVGGVLV